MNLLFEVKKHYRLLIILTMLMSLILLLTGLCVHLNNQVKVYEAERDMMKSNQINQMISKMRIQTWICKDYAHLIQDVVTEDKDIEALCSYANAVRQFTSPDVFDGLYQLEYGNDDTLLKFIQKLMSSITLSETYLREASLAELEVLGENFEQLAILLHNNQAEDTLSYYLWYHVYDTPLKASEENELSALINQIEPLLNDIMKYNSAYIK